MPNLPTITVTDEQLARITSAFPGETTAEKVESYRTWLKRELRKEVTKSELKALNESHTAAVNAKYDELNSQLLT